jgi:hypothetical protein
VPETARDGDRSSTAAELESRLRSLALGMGLALSGREVAGDPELRAALAGVRARIEAAAEALDGLEPAAARERLARLHATLRAWQARLRATFDRALATRPLVPADLPALVRADAVSEDGELLLEVYPLADVWEPEHQRVFVAETRRVDPEVTGLPVQIYESSVLMRDSYGRAGLYALVAVFLAVLFDFRRLTDALLALVPVGMGFLFTFAVMDLAGVSVNPANVIILPLLFGMGVDAGVHMLHRYRQHPEEHPPGLAAGTGKGIVLTSLTTMIGFSSMLLAHHRGIRSLGFVVSVGMAATLVACLTLMPALLELRGRAASRSKASRQGTLPRGGPPA